MLVSSDARNSLASPDYRTNVEIVWGRSPIEAAPSRAASDGRMVIPRTVVRGDGRNDGAIAELEFGSAQMKKIVLANGRTPSETNPVTRPPLLVATRSRWLSLAMEDVPCPRRRAPHLSSPAASPKYRAPDALAAIHLAAIIFSPAFSLMPASRRLTKARRGAGRCECRPLQGHGRGVVAAEEERVAIECSSPLQLQCRRITAQKRRCTSAEQALTPSPPITGPGSSRSPGSGWDVARQPPTPAATPSLESGQALDLPFMAHIADWLANTPSSPALNNTMANAVPPSSPHVISPATVAAAAPDVPLSDESDKHVWRMLQPSEPRRYQLFPSAKEKLPPAGKRTADVDSSLVTGLSGVKDKDGSLSGNSLRLKSKDRNRRRKASCPDVGPMTTVQEVLMDSPTIPGHPAMQEQSISVPGNSWRQHVFGESILSCISGPALDEGFEGDTAGSAQPRAKTLSRSANPDSNSLTSLITQAQPQAQRPKPNPKTQQIHFETQKQASLPRNESAASPKRPTSPKSLAPLVISAPTTQPARLTQQSSASRLPSRSRSDGDDTPPEVPPKSARMSPRPRASPYTPLSSTSTSVTASTAPNSVQSTPVSGLPYTHDPIDSRSSPVRSSPKPFSNPHLPFEGRSSPRPKGISSAPNFPQNHVCHTRGHSEVLNISQPSFAAHPASPLKGHRRHGSEGASSIVDRGRPQNRSSSEGSPAKPQPSEPKTSPAPPSKNNPIGHSQSPSPQKDRELDRLLSQRAFEHLPTGHPATHAASHLSPTELTTLHQQALGQALRFQVLATKDVECLSRELRALDERCGYLLKTHRSLRAGRRSLHARVCSYLRSPRTARFSHESMLRQEEALSELDASIDDWVCKLEQAENRRTRVRQKLLEHVAAALLVSQDVVGERQDVVGEGHEVLEEVLRLGGERRKPLPLALPLPPPKQAPNASCALPREPNTPPRSPTKTSGLAPVAEASQVKAKVKVSSPAPSTSPSTTAPSPPSSSTSVTAPSPASFLSPPGIPLPSSRSRISALLADVEDEIFRMEMLDAEAEAVVGKAVVGKAVMLVKTAEQKEAQLEMMKARAEVRVMEIGMGGEVGWEESMLLSYVTFEGLKENPENGGREGSGPSEG
ncbi:unnamed protein product [Diplocarpon coronariae]